jgi:chloramphenicol O-acetyltransferase type A
MRQINLETWPRREYFKLYNSFDHPHFNLCANVDLTAFYPVIKQQNISITIAIVYIISRAANTIPEFRYRIRGGDVIEHAIVHPSTTILTGDQLFSFCTIEYTQDFSVFAARATEQINYVRNHLTIKDKSGQDDLLFMTAIPWISFTSFMHPINLNPADSIPRFAWGKFIKDGNPMKMPLSVQGHHALMDGIHMARYYELVQELMNHPNFLPGSVQAQLE